MTSPISPRVVPEESELTAPYWASAQLGRVALQRCLDCGLVWHPPAPSCPAGAAHRIEWFESSGRGRLYSYTVVEHAVHPAVIGALPYLLALVALDEGPRLICNLVSADPSNLSADLPVTLSAGPAAGGLTLPVARLDESAT
ncbi:MAG: uncharacterized protein QOD87_2282 [Pseudonocardiales bacterium]|nr:uncharacterized protein [Pseudonocardiales bacterium]